MLKMTTFLLIFFCNACAFIYTGNDQRELQTKIISAINQKSEQYAKCASKHQLFSKLDKKRVRVELFLDINHMGLIEKFKLGGDNYPQGFTDCFFGIVELISFPRFKSHEIIKLEQPFIFSKK